MTDKASILPAEAVSEIDKLLGDFERETCHRYVVATVSDLEGLAVEDFALSVANSSDIGDDNLKNVLMVLVAPNQREARIEVGCGLESAISDAEVARVMKESLIPEFRQANYTRGILNGLRELMAMGRAKSVPKDLRPEICVHGE